MDSYAFLDDLKAQKKKEKLIFDDFSDFLEEKARQTATPINGQFELTPLCNLDCRMCYVHLQPEQLDQQILGVEAWKSLIDQAWEAGMFQVTLTGGECLTYPGFEELYLYLHSKGCQITVLTNGVLLNERWISFFKEHPPAVIQVTLYGSDDDTYERVTGRRAAGTVIENVKAAKEAKIVTVLSVTPSVFLGEDIFNILDLGKKLDVPVYINTSLFDPRTETGRAGQDADVDAEMYARIWRYRRELEGGTPREIPVEELPEPGGPCHECSEKGLRCGGGRSGFVIDWKGTMHTCNRLPFGSYPLRDGFKAAWKQVNEFAENFPRVPECKGCAYESVCDACAARMTKYAEPGERPAPFCEMTRYLVHRGVTTIPECE